MIAPFLIPLIASGVGAASKGAMAAYQNKMANKVAKPRPTYTRPGEVVTAEALAANAYNSAGDTRLEQQAIDNSVANSAYQLGNSGNSSATNMAMIAALNANANRAKTTAVLEGRQRKDQLRGSYQQQLSNSAQYTDKEFQVNKFEPYQNAALAAQQLKSAAGKNMEGAIKDLIAGGLNATSMGLTGKLTARKNPLLETTKILEKFGLKPEQMKSVTDLVMAGDLEGVKKLLGETHSQSQISNIIKRVATIGNTNNPITTTDNTNNSPVTENSNELEATFVKMFPYNEQNKLYYETRFPHLIPEYAKPRPDDGRPIIRLEPTQESDVSNTFNADKSVPEFKTETDINSAATMLGVKPSILENALSTEAKEGLGSITNPDILSSVFHEGLDVEESNTILSEMLGKIQGLLDKNAISQEEFEQATAELTRAATVNRKKKDSKKISNQVMKTIAPLASIINY